MVRRIGDYILVVFLITASLEIPLLLNELRTDYDDIIRTVLQWCKKQPVKCLELSRSPYCLAKWSVWAIWG